MQLDQTFLDYKAFAGVAQVAVKALERCVEGVDYFGTFFAIAKWYGVFDFLLKQQLNAWDKSEVLSAHNECSRWMRLFSDRFEFILKPPNQVEITQLDLSSPAIRTEDLAPKKHRSPKVWTDEERDEVIAMVIAHPDDKSKVELFDAIVERFKLHSRSQAEYVTQVVEGKQK